MREWRKGAKIIQKQRKKTKSEDVSVNRKDKKKVNCGGKRKKNSMGEQMQKKKKEQYVNGSV